MPTQSYQIIKNSITSVENERKVIAGMKVLVIDNDEANRMALRKILGAWGIKVSEFGDGRNGISELERARDRGEPFHVVLLACRMPAMEGFEVAEHIKNRPSLCVTIIMMIMPDHRDEDAEKVQALGINTYLVKPLKYSELQQAIGTAMHHRKESESAATPEATMVSHTTNHLFRILLAEDHEGNRTFIRTYLKHTSCLLDMAENGEIACRKFVGGNFDLVIMDIMMPVMDGYAATRWIRNWEQERQKKPTPIIALTAHTLKEHSRKCLDAGCNACITKPVRKKELLEIIHALGVSMNGPSPFPSGNLEKDARTRITFLPGGEKKCVVCVDEALKNYVTRFFEVTSEDMASIKQALSVGDFETVQRIGHGMMGSGVSFGFKTITDLGKSIEQAAKAGKGDEIRRYLADLINYMETVEVVFE
ncbi:MAG TPA: response regulator [Deltaproteobacteria bacterium]|nr:response regulator [Deltaproteobacteria bacterium]